MATAGQYNRPETERTLDSCLGLGKSLWSVLSNIPPLQYPQHLPGDVVYLHVLGQGLVFLNSHAAAIELMERRSAIYSDRAPLVMVTELLVPYTGTISLTADHDHSSFVSSCGAGHMVRILMLRHPCGLQNSTVPPGCLYALWGRISSSAACHGTWFWVREDPSVPPPYHCIYAPTVAQFDHLKRS